jgi:hypothetical protein
MGEKAEGGKPSVDDLQTLGITNVTADNIAAIRVAFFPLSSNGQDYEALADLQNTVDLGIKAYFTALKDIITVASNEDLYNLTQNGKLPDDLKEILINNITAHIWNLGVTNLDSESYAFVFSLLMEKTSLRNS